MRRTALLALTLLMALPPVSAHAQSGWNFGTATCGPAFPCANLDAMLPSLTGTASSCLSRRFGFSGSNIFAPRIDSSLCLDLAMEIPPSSVGMTVTPNCCITRLSETSCQLQCTLIGKK